MKKLQKIIIAILTIAIIMTILCGATICEASADENVG